MYRDVLGFSIAPFMQRVMSINGFFASIMRTGKKSEDDKDTLPSGVPIPVLPVDYLKVKPDNWIGGEGSYVCPIDSDWGLWFNFTMNNQRNIAVLPSVKGMNPLTGLRVGGYALEDYEDECPVHKKLFSKGKLCTECGFKWPFQNYISAPNKFFIDGFLTPSGVRQFYFTEEMSKSVPEQVIGKEDCVPAFGFCFYKLKEYDGHYEEGKHVKNEFPADSRSNGFLLKSLTSHGRGEYRGAVSTKGYVMPDAYVGTIRDHMLRESSTDLPRDSLTFTADMSSGDSVKSAYFTTSSLDMPAACGASPAELGISTLGISTSNPMEKLVGDYLKHASKRAKQADSMIEPLILRRGPTYEDSKRSRCMTDGLEKEMGVLYSPGFSPESVVRKSAEVGIGAGAKIKQSFEQSNKAVKDWEEKPAGVIRLYFVFQEEFEKYAAAGFNSLEGNEAGYLEGVTVGGSRE